MTEKTIDKPYMCYGENHPNAKLTEESVRNLCKDYEAGANIPELVEKYGISNSRVWKIINGYAWIDVTGGKSIARVKKRTIPRETILKIRKEYASGDLQRVIAERYGITQSQVSEIISNKTYKKYKGTWEK